MGFGPGGWWLRWAALAACGPSVAVPLRTPAGVTAPPVSPAADAEPAAAATALEPADLVVGSEEGLEILGADGKQKRLVSAGPALHPHWLDASSLLVLNPAEPENFAFGGRLERISLQDGRRTEIARLPRFGCKGQQLDDDSVLAVNLQDEKDFVVDATQGLVCVQLLDRNVNMADVSLVVHIDLAKHSVERWLDMGVGCTPPSEVHVGDAPNECAQAQVLASLGGNPTAEPPPEAFTFDLDAEGNVLETTQRGVKKVLQVPGYAAESLSPSGRWRLLQGDPTEGDYMYRSLILLDRTRGLVYPILPEQSGWPKPLAASGKSHRVRTPIELTLQVATEEDVRWLGAGSSELLVIDGFAIRPELGAFPLRGQVAR